MTENIIELGKASKMVEAILDYIYEEGEDKVTNAEILGIIEFVRFQFLENLKEEDK